MSSIDTNAHDAAKAASRETVRDILGTLSMMRDEFTRQANDSFEGSDDERMWKTREYAIYLAQARIRRDFKA